MIEPRKWQEDTSQEQRNTLNAACGDLAAQIEWHGFKCGVELQLSGQALQGFPPSITRRITDLIQLPLWGIKMLTREELKSEVSYDPISGIFLWLRNGRGQTKRIGEVAGSAHSGGYVRIKISGKTYFAHRLAFLLMSGEWPQNEVDHKNGIRHDNRWDNLRLATVSQNRQHCAGHPNRRKSIFKGVVKEHACETWKAQIAVDGKTIHLGNFPCEEEAAEAYRVAAVQYHGEFAKW